MDRPAGSSTLRWVAVELWQPVGYVNNSVPCIIGIAYTNIIILTLVLFSMLLDSKLVVLVNNESILSFDAFDNS